jgi:hypothetical protein
VTQRYAGRIVSNSATLAPYNQALLYRLLQLSLLQQLQVRHLSRNRRRAAMRAKAGWGRRSGRFIALLPPCIRRNRRRAAVRAKAGWGFDLARLAISS